MPKVVDLTGMKFGRLTVIGKAPGEYISGKTRRSVWECRCECGNTKTVIGANLRAGLTRSCGCLQRETVTKNREGRTAKETVMKQLDEMVDFMRENGSITGLDCVGLGILNYRGRIADLRRLGFKIETRYETTLNSKGEKKTYARYVLVGGV